MTSPVVRATLNSRQALSGHRKVASEPAIFLAVFPIRGATHTSSPTT